MDEPIITEPAPVEPPAPEPIPEPIAPAPQPGRRIDITVQAATDQALTVLLMTYGVLVAGEAGVRPADGVIHSHIGDAELDGVKLAGKYAFVSIDEGIVGEDRTASLLLALDPHTYKGPPLRVLLGGSNFDPDSGVPFSVTAAQARLALIEVGKLDKVLAVLDAIPDLKERAKAKAVFEYATEIRRNHPLIAALRPALKMTEADMDQLFILARTLNK
jgi:hypothetical protein